MGINKKRKKKKKNEIVVTSNTEEKDEKDINKEEDNIENKKDRYNEEKDNIENDNEQNNNEQNDNGKDNKEKGNKEEGNKEEDNKEEDNKEEDKKDENHLSDVVIDINKNVEYFFKDAQRQIQSNDETDKDKDKSENKNTKEKKDNIFSDYIVNTMKEQEQRIKCHSNKTSWIHENCNALENDESDQRKEFVQKRKGEDSFRRRKLIRFNEKEREANKITSNIHSNFKRKHLLKSHSISNFNISDPSNEECHNRMKNMNQCQKRKMKHHRNKEFVWKNKNSEQASFEYIKDSNVPMKLLDDSKRNEMFSLSKYILERKEKNTINHRKTKKTDSFYINDQVRLVKFICYTKSYDLEKLHKVLLSKKIQSQFFDENNILCVFLSPEGCVKNFYSSEDLYKIDNLDLKKNVTYPNSKYIFFIFKNGSVVIWENFKNYENNDYFINKITLFLNAFSNELLPVYLVQSDTLFYSEQPTPTHIVSNGIIYLSENNLEQKLTVSFALSQSIRLDVHEIMMDIAITTLFNISKDIASTGTCNISKKKVSSMLNIYSSTINVNAVQDFLDIPEYFWNKVQYEHLWFELYKYLEIPERIKILNKRYDYYKDFLKVITTELYNKKTFHCYWIIVWLLFVHVVALILNDIFFTK